MHTKTTHQNNSPHLHKLDRLRLHRGALVPTQLLRKHLDLLSAQAEHHWGQDGPHKPVKNEFKKKRINMYIHFKTKEKKHNPPRHHESQITSTNGSINCIELSLHEKIFAKSGENTKLLQRLERLDTPSSKGCSAAPSRGTSWLSGSENSFQMAHERFVDLDFLVVP